MGVQLRRLQEKCQRQNASQEAATLHMREERRRSTRRTERRAGHRQQKERRGERAPPRWGRKGDGAGQQLAEGGTAKPIYFREDGGAEHTARKQRERGWATDLRRAKEGMGAQEIRR